MTDKKIYFAELRKQRQKAKELAIEMSEDLSAQFTIAKNKVENLSPYGFMFMYSQLEENWLDGIPAIDTMTYKKRIENGYRVKKGEKSKLRWITRKKIDKKDEEGSYMIPKAYSVFHRSQVEAI